jgi:hypothetical protein
MPCRFVCEPGLRGVMCVVNIYVSVIQIAKANGYKVLATCSSQNDGVSLSRSSTPNQMTAHLS